VIALFLLTACLDGPPELVSVNGEAVLRAEPWVTLDGEVGEVVPIAIEVAGRGDPRAWSVGAPPGWVVDPDAHRGEWQVEANATTSFTLLLEDVDGDLSAWPVLLYPYEP